MEVGNAVVYSTAFGLEREPTVSDEGLRFAAFAAVGATALVAGYVARQRGILPERWSRTIHLHTVIWIWSSVTLVMFWGIRIDAQLLTLMAIQPLVMLVSWGLAGWAARRLRMPPRQAGPLALACAMSNQGFTLGAYLCYTILEPGHVAMGYAIAYVTSMQVFMVIILYPVARHYELLARRADPAQAATAEQLPPVPRLIAQSFIDIRATPLYAAVTGAVLSLTTAGPPAWVRTSPVIDVVCFVGAVGSYLGIGLRLRVGDWRHHVRDHAVAAIIKFVAMPAVVFGLLAALPAIGLGVSPLARDVLLVSSCMPSAIACVIVSNLFHLDARLASILWLVNTAAFCLLPLPILLYVFSA